MIMFILILTNVVILVLWTPNFPCLVDKEAILDIIPLVIYLLYS